MPVFNRAPIVRRAIDSVLGQDFADFELVVVDDGSTDGTAERVAQTEDPRVRLIRLERNGGSNAARNRGIEAAQSNLIAFLDSDDAYLPHKLGRVVGIFGDQPDLEVLLDSFRKLYPPGHSRKEARRRNPVIDSTEAFSAALFSRRLWKATSAITARRDALIRAGMFDEKLRRRQDMDVLIRLARVARCASTDELLWEKSWTPGAISDNPKSFLAATFELTRRYPEYLTNPDFRPGLARDTARHLGRRIGAGDLGGAAHDGRALAREFGAGRLARLIAQGGWELLRRHVRRALRRGGS